MEELYPLYSEQYHTLARIYWLRKDGKNARKYAEMSLEILEEQGYIDSSPEHLEILMRSLGADTSEKER